MRHPQRQLFVVAALAVSTLLPGGSSRADTPAGVAEYIVPFDEDVFAYVTSRVTGGNVPANSTSRATVDVTAWSNSVRLYYDHWENGYGLNPDTLTGADEVYELTVGQTLTFLSAAVPRPRTDGTGNGYIGTNGNCTNQPPPGTPISRTTTNFCYDGRDRFVTVGGATTVTRGGWLAATDIHAAVGEEVYPLAPQLIKYVLPFGEDAVRVDYERVVAVIQATENDTTIRIDFNGDGTYDSFNTENGYRTQRVDPTDATTLTLQRGESYVLDRDSDGIGGTLPRGVVILGDKTLQVEYFYGDYGSTYNTRAVAAYPRGFWGDEYYAPVDGSTGGYDTDVTLYNPNASAITISWETTVGSGSFTLAANETAFFQAKTGSFVPDGSALYLKGSGVFWGISDIDTNNSAYDWSYSLVPSYLLKSDQFISWAPGNTPVQNPPGTNGRAQGIFLTPVQDQTTFFVDRNADGVPDTTFEVINGGTAVAPTGNGYRANRLQSLYITDNDGDMTGAHIWATGPFAMAYGENPQRASESGGVDLGYTVLPSPADWMDLALTVDKTTSPTVVSTVAGATTVTYTLVVDSHLFNLTTVDVVDTLPANWTYVANSSTITFPNLTQLTGAAANPTVSLQTLTWPAGLLGGMLPNQRITITFQAKTTAAFASGALTQNSMQATGTRSVGAVSQTFRATDFVFNTYLDSSVGMTVTKAPFPPESTPVSPGDAITYTVTVTNPASSTLPLTGVTVYDSLPPGVTYVAGSAQVTAPNPALSNVRDNFGSNVLNNNDGSVNWVGSWVESDSTQSATAGFVQVNGGRLRLTQASDVYRQVNLSGRSWARLTFDYATSDSLEDADASWVEVATSAAGPWTTVLTFVNDVAGSVTYHIPAALLSATTTVRFRTTGHGRNGEYTYFDNVDVTFPATTGTVTSAGHNPPSFVTAADGYVLGPNQSLTLTFTATVVTPLPAGQTEIRNLATAIANEIPIPISDDALNQVVNPGVLSATVGDRVWLDNDGDGVLDVGEAGLPGVEVTLKDQWGAPLQVTTTDSQGRYTFVGVTPGSGYFVAVTGGVPAGLVQSSDGRTDNRTNGFNLAAGQTYLNADVGYKAAAGTATIGDLVWSDADGDTIRDAGEPGIAGVTVQLIFDANGNGIGDDPVTATAVTGPDGSYLFTGIAADGLRDYLVSVAVGQPALSAYNVTTPTIYLFPDVPIGASYVSADFGFRQKAAGTTYTITDRVWLDNGAGVGGIAADGLQNGTEAGLGGITVALENSAGITVATTTTGANGNFQFTGVPAGANYRWRVTDAAGVLSNYYPTTPSAVAGSFQMAGNLGGNLDYTATPHFGYNLTRAIGDTVFNDIDGSGLQNGTEPGISGASVLLYRDVNGNGAFEPGGADGAPVGSLVTDANGRYLFTGLTNGSYWVTIDRTQAALSGYSSLTTADDSAAAGDQRFVGLSGGASVLDVDYGYRASTSYALSGRIWNDTNNDGQINGEPGIPGVTLEVLQGTTVIGTATTDGSGNYSFPGLPQGRTYTVRITDFANVLSGFTSTFEKSEGTAAPFDSQEVVRNLSANVTDLHFGFYRPQIPTLPVSLAWFRSSAGRRGVLLEWQTSAEAGNVGFNVWGEVGSGKVKLNGELIPSQAMSTLGTSSYSLEVPAGPTRFWLEEVDLETRLRRHGPFDLGRTSGVTEVADRVDWESVNRESAGKQLERARNATNGLTRMPDVGIRLVVDREGMYRVTYEQLRAAGFDLADVAPQSLVLTNRDQVVPTWMGSSMGFARTFGPGSFLVFWGEGVKSLYTKENVYRLTVDPRSTRRAMELDPRAPSSMVKPAVSYSETVLVDRNREYSFASPTGDPWYDTRFLAYRSPVEARFSLDLPDLAPGGGGQLTVGLWGSTDWPASPDHHVVVRWNGQPVADTLFDGVTNQPLSIELSASQLKAGANQLDVVLPGDSGVDYEVTILDTYSVTYPRLFVARENRLAFGSKLGQFAVEGFTAPDVYVFRRPGGLGDPQVVAGVVVEPSGRGYRARFPGSAVASRNPDKYQVTTGAAFLTPRIEVGRAGVDFSTKGGPVTMLVIAHPDFVGGIAPLLDARAKQGISTRVVDVEAVYEEYSGGVVDPAAIREMVREARELWGIRSVLLVGGDTYDYQNALGLSSKSFVPTLYAQTDPVIVRFAPADALYGDVDGDGVPEVAVGRFPVRTSAELSLMISKTLAWKRLERAVLAADQSEAFLDFSALSDDLAAKVPAGIAVSRAYMDTLGVTGARAALRAEMNGGGAYVGFLGHSSYARWSFAGLFTTGDASALTNSGRPLVVNQFGCWNNYFVEPAYDTLGHVLLVSGDRGAAATLGMATLSNVETEGLLGPILVPRLMENGKSIGQALVEAKAEVARVAPNRPDVQIGMTLLGDPELVLNP